MAEEKMNILRRENQILKKKLRRYQKAKQPRKITKKTRDQIVTDALQPFFGKTQISFFLRKNSMRGKGWSQEDMRKALTLRLLSKKTYKFLRSKKWIPLPGN